jgi:large subunit ribosomal protein L5
MAKATDIQKGLRERYRSEVLPNLAKELGLKNVMAAPRLTKVVLNVGIGKIHQNNALIDFIKENLVAITGQKPVVTKARVSIATFKVREGMPSGLMITLRGNKMLDFLERLVTFALPRVRDFRGLRPNFDGHGNYTLGLREHIVFPEGIYESPDKIFGMAVTIATTAKNDEELLKLLTLIGFPFIKKENA